MSSQVLVERTATRAVLILNRPEKLNALSRRMKEELRRNLEDLADDGQLRVVILTGTGDMAFCAGTDINELAGITGAEALQISQEGQRLCEQIERFPVPVIAAVNGVAAGGGFELIMACHLRVASDAATFSLPETWLGLIPGYGATQRLSREIGPGRTLEWMLTRKIVSGDEAFELGLVNRIVSSAMLKDEVLALASEIEQLSPLAIRASLKAVLGGLELSLEDGLALETEVFASLFASEDAKEGTSAFLQKRKPVFKGR